MKKLRSLILLFSFVVLFPFAVSAAEEKEEELGFWFEVIQTSGKPSSIEGWYQKDLVGRFGIYAVVYRDSSRYTSGVVGPSIKLTDWLQAGIGMGREKSAGAPSSNLTNAYFEIDTDFASVFGEFEKGDGGRWHKVVATWKATETLGLGVMDQKDLGLGPRIDYTFAKGATAWTGCFWNRREGNERSCVLAVNYSF